MLNSDNNNIIKNLYRVTGILFDRSDNRQRFEKYTYATDDKRAVSNVRYTMGKSHNGSVILRDVSVNIMIGHVSAAAKPTYISLFN